MSAPSFPPDEATPRSSTLYADGHPALSAFKEVDHSDSSAPSHLSPALTQEIERERFGWDDPRDPPALQTPGESVTSTVDEGAAASLSEKGKVDWDGPDDPENPHNWTVRKRWWYTIVSIFMTLNVTFASSSPSVTTTYLAKEFHVSAEVSYLVTTVFLVGYIFGPLFWGPGSELVGRRPIFIFSLVAYTLFHLGQALAQNIETFLITRFLGGFFAAAPLTNAPGLISDLWPASTRGNAVSLFTVMVFLGPVIGPIVSSFIVSSGVSWRWVYWVMMMFAGVCTAMSVIVPETYAPIILQRKAKKLRKADPEGNAHVYAEHEKQDWSVKGVLHRTLYRPFLMLALEPILTLVTIYMSLVYGVLYALFSAFPIIWAQTRHFTIWQSSLIFIGIGIGSTIGAIINSWTNRHYPQLMKQWRGFPPPEERLIGGMFGGPALVIGAFWLGWTGQYASVPWYVPAIATIILGAGISLIFMSFISYIVDTYLAYAASAIAANTMIRSGVAAAFPLFTVQMFHKLGINWACTLIGCIALVLSPSAFLFRKYGPIIRANSKFAPCIDLKIAKELEEESRQEKSRV